MKIIFFKIPAILTLLFYVNILYAQTWKELNPPPNIFNGSIKSSVTDNTGNVYAAGNFKNTNNQYFVAKWNGNNWSELGIGSNALKANNPISAIAIDNAGNIYAAGGFTNTSGNYYVAKWNGSNWADLGTGSAGLNPNGIIYALTVDNTGYLYAAGGFSNTSGKKFVAKWNGSSWSELGTGTNALNANGLIYSIATDQSGKVYTAGQFTNSNNKNYVAVWNGTTWTELGTTVPLSANDYITSIKADDNGNVYTAGAFKNNSGKCYVAKYNGSSWAELGIGANALNANGPINALALNTTGNIYAGGFGTNINGATNLLRWNGTSWNELFTVGSSINNSIRSINIDNTGNIYTGGDFKNINDHNYIAKWDGTIMKELGRQGEFLPSHNGIRLITSDVFGRVYAIGSFWTNPGAGITDVAKWDGVGWTHMKNSNNVNVENAEAITTDNLGNVYIGGRFTNLNGEYYVAKWDGTNWIELSNSATPLHATGRIIWLSTDSSGNIYATGLFNENGTLYGIAKWNGNTWSKFPGFPGNSINCLVPATGGNVYVSTFTYVAKTGPNFPWTEVGSGTNSLNANSFINSIAVDYNGNLYAGGYFTNSSFNAYVAKWNGTNWGELGSIPNASYISSLAGDSGGNIFAAISSNSNSRFYVAKWNGSNWSELGSGTNSLQANSNINTLSIDTAGNIYAAGGFGNNSGQNYVAGYGKSLLQLQSPVITPVASTYCSANGVQKVRILNIPDSSRIRILVKLDAVRLSISADSSFSFNVSTISPGLHKLKVAFSINSDTISISNDFIINTAVTPDVNLSANTTIVTNSNPVIVTAANSSGGGITPLFTFAKDRLINTLLQAESTNNVLTLNPNTLLPGHNWIYVRMRTSDTCYTSQSNIDSIDIVQNIVTGLIDIDYPGKIISVYPIPFNELLTIRGLNSNKSYSIQIFNSLGQQVFERKVSNSFSLTTITNFITVKGNYMLSIYDNTKKRLLGIVSLIKQ